jgi:hypothetical protein
MSALVRHTDDLFTRDAPLSFMGFKLGTRMTVIRLRDKTLLVHSPVALDDATKKEIDALGEVAHVVAPSLFHHLHAGPAIAAYPKATLWAPRALRDKRKDLRIDRDLEDATAGTWREDLVPVAIEGTMLGETVFVHPSSRSVVSADLTENFTSSDHLPTRLYLKAGGVYGKPGWNRLLRFVYRDKRAARRSVDRLLEHDFDRLFLAHGDVIETGAKRALEDTFVFLG